MSSSYKNWPLPSRMVADPIAVIMQKYHEVYNYENIPCYFFLFLSWKTQQFDIVGSKTD